MGVAAYRIDPGDIDRDRDTLLAIWQGNLGQDGLMRQKFDWFYKQAPQGRPLVHLLRHEPEGQVVGVASAGRRRMTCAGKELRAGVMVDLAVVPAHRALGPAILLQQSLIRDAAASFDLLYGFPNAKAVPVFKRAGFKQLGDMVRRVRILRHSSYLARHWPRPVAWFASVFLDAFVRARDAWRSLGAGARMTAQWSSEADPRMDELWFRIKPRTTIAGVRDHAFSRWRFDASPLADARYLLVSDPDTGRLRAWFTCQTVDQVLRVCDFHGDGPGDVVNADAVRLLLQMARREGCVAVSMEAAGETAWQASWIEAGFIERGRRPVFGRWLGTTPQADLPLQLTLADEDE